jgi:hypothetical protein
MGLNPGTIYWMDVSNASSYNIHKKIKNKNKCTRVENPREGVPEVFAKIPREGQGFQENLPGRSPISSFIAF